jgi:hypothetical protein
VQTIVATGRATNIRTTASTVPSRATSPNDDGKTSRPSTRNIASWATQARPSWNVAMVWRAGIADEPSVSPARYTARKPEPCSTSAAP